MSALFGQQNGPTRINGVQINQSVQGYCIPVILGKGKVQQSIIWTDGFTQTLVNSTGGKGFGSAKGGNQYAYSADVIAALCDGGSGIGIGDVWSGQSWLSNTATTETTTITGGSPYLPANATSMTADAGVSFTSSYSATLTDLGSGGATTLAGSMAVPLKKKAYGTVLATGQYSVNPATNEYHFSTADNGRTVAMSYSFSLSAIKKQLISLIPAGRTITVGTNTDNEAFAIDGGVFYYSGGGGDPLNGVAFQKVTGTPTLAGTYSVTLDSVTMSGGTPSYKSQPATYNFAPGDVGQEVLITWQVSDPASIPIGTQTSLSFTLLEGSKGQTPWALLESSYPGAALGYPGVALICYGPMDMGYSAQIQNNVFEVLTGDAWGAGIADCNPVMCILQVLTNPVWGLGVGPVPFPVACIDNGTGGTWGSGQGTGALQQDSTATSWFAANGFFISPVIDKQDTAGSLISKWLEAGQCAMFMSEGLLKLVPYGDTSTAGNGCVWVAPQNFVTAYDDTCFTFKKGKDPVEISEGPWMDAFSTVQVSWNNPAHQYSPEITQESDQAAIDRYGSRIEDPQAWDFITSLPSATFAASMRVKRMVYIRGEYKFSVPLNQGIEVEPMDVVYISTESIWGLGLNNQNLGIVNLPVRVMKITDNAKDGSYDMIAEDYPFGVHEPTIYNKGVNAGQPQPNQFGDPGDTKVVLFNATGRLVTYGYNEIWIGATGINALWGSCNVYASIDGDTYKQIGTIDTAARLGTLDASFPLTGDPDTTTSLVVDLAANSASLDSASVADADANNTLCYVDGEYISFSSCAVTAQDQYTMSTYLRRGQMGSVAAAHAAGSNFLRLDNAVLRYEYDPSWAGQTVLLKFQSVNLWGNSAQDLSALTPVSFVVAPIQPSTIFVTGTTSNPAVSDSALTALPELTTTNPAMSIETDGNHPGQMTISLAFSASSGSGSGGEVGYLGVDFTGSFPNTGSTPDISISISGDGSGASASVSWSVTGFYPNFVATPSLSKYGGSGYTHATATVTITNGNSTYPNGVTTYTCGIYTPTPVAAVPVLVDVRMDGSAILGPFATLTDAAGNALFNVTLLVFPLLGLHTFEVRALNQSPSNTVVSTSRSFQFAALG